MKVAWVIVALVVIACLAVLGVVLRPGDTPSPNFCALEALHNCDTKDFNKYCDDFVETTENVFCSRRCDELAASSPNVNLPPHTYCLRLPRYRRYSACASPVRFGLPTCTDVELRAYCARDEGSVICGEACVNARTTLAAPFPADESDLDTLCDNPFCAPWRDDTPYCTMACYRHPLLSPECQEEEREDILNYCFTFSSNNLCLTECAKEPDHPFCQDFL
jgi:hypothetical protein